jgi:hypothetical protein
MKLPRVSCAKEAFCRCIVSRLTRRLTRVVHYTFDQDTAGTLSYAFT